MNKYPVCFETEFIPDNLKVKSEEKYYQMIHSITKLKHITDNEAELYTELDYTRFIIFEGLEAKQTEYRIELNRELNRS